MKGIILCVFAIIALTSAQGGEKERMELFLESEGLEEEVVNMKCFRCDLGFWDACYTTETNCSLGEVCYTGRGKAADSLDIKMLGCTKAEECNMETTVELFLKKTIFVMTKHCCDTPFCNSAHKIPVYTLLQFIAFLTTWHLNEASTGS